jgi:hypothetical protein
MYVLCGWVCGCISFDGLYNNKAFVKEIICLGVEFNTRGDSWIV